MRVINAISIILIVGSLMFAANKLSIWIAPVTLVLSLVAMAVIALLSRRKKSQIAGRSSIDHGKLHALQIAHLKPWLKEQVRGHDQTIDGILTELDRNLRLSKSGRLLGAFFLAGPTGTGKTFLAQLIGEGLYPDSAPIIIRMNQYKSPQDVYTLLGPPLGTPGYEIGGTLTKPLIENPYRVVILDEIEKAHRDVPHCLYDILDTASCVEKRTGRPVDFSAAIFFATSNAAVDELRAIRCISSAGGSWQAKSRDALVDAGGFERAFLARWTAVHFMDELSTVNIAEVACLQLVKHWKEYGIELEYTSPEVLLAAVQGNEEFKQYGVRQLGAYLREQTKDAVFDAVHRGAKKAWLGVDRSGGISLMADR